MKFTDRLNSKSLKPIKDMLLRVELCARSGYSAEKGVGSVASLVKGAKEYGIAALALCDDYSTGGYAELYYYCKKEEIDAIYGVTIIINNTKVVVLAKNTNGVIAINKLISMSKPDDSAIGCYNELEDLNDFRDDIICVGVLSNLNENLDFIMKHFDYIGVAPYSRYPFTKDEEKKIRLYTSRVVAISDSYYLTKSDKLAYDALRGTTTRLLNNLKSGYELLNVFEEEEFVIDNPLNLIASIEDNAYGKGLDYLDNLDLITADDFRKLVNEKVHSKPEFGKESYKNNLKIELDAVIENGYWNIFYLNYRITEEIKKSGEHYGFRGCMGNSMINYALGITDIDPIKWELPFEVFLGFHGDRMPDFDLNVSSNMKEKIFNIIESIVGSGNVVVAGTVERLTDRQIGRLIAKHMNECGFYDSDTMANAKIFRLEDTVVDYGMHPGGHIIKSSKNSFYEYTPIKKLEGRNVFTTLNDFHTYHDHFIKQDVLVFTYYDFVKQIETITNTKIEDIPTNDSEVMSLFEDDRALRKKRIINEEANPLLGIYEFGTQFARSVIKATNPKDINDLIKVVGLCHGTQLWTGNLEGFFKAGVCKLEDVLANRDEIYGYLIYKGLPATVSFCVMEDVRKGRGLKPEYVEVMKAAKVPQYIIDSLNKIRYMFPRSHSVCYTINALKMAYYKVHYPAEFYTALFNARFKDVLSRIAHFKLEDFDKTKNEYSDDELTAINHLLEAIERGYILEVNDEGIATFSAEKD